HLTEVHHVERKAETLGDEACVEEIVERATAAVARPGPEPHRHTDDVVAGLDQQRHRQRAVDAAAHGDDDPFTRGGHRHPATARRSPMPRARSTTRRSAVAAAATSAVVVCGPRLKRTPPRAALSSQPMARNTYDGSPDPAAQADP